MKILTGARSRSERGPIALAFLNAGVSLHVEREGFDAAVVAKTYARQYRRRRELPRSAARRDVAKTRAARSRSTPRSPVIMASRRSAAYGSSKAALIYMAEALRLKLPRRGPHHTGRQSRICPHRDDRSGKGFQLSRSRSGRRRRRSSFATGLSAAASRSHFPGNWRFCKSSCARCLMPPNFNFIDYGMNRAKRRG